MTMWDRSLRGRPLARLLRFAAGLLAGLTLSPLAVASIPAARSTEIPKAWLVYAGQAGQSLSAWLSSDAPAALRLRSELDSTRPTADQPPPAVPVAIWIGADGMVSRVDGPFPAHSPSETDLRALLVGHRLPSRPPPDMLQPVRLQLQLEPAPARTESSPDRPLPAG
jgi:hypothetical protein